MLALEALVADDVTAGDEGGLISSRLSCGGGCSCCGLVAVLLFEENKRSAALNELAPLCWGTNSDGDGE